MAVYQGARPRASSPSAAGRPRSRASRRPALPRRRAAPPSGPAAAVRIGFVLAAIVIAFAGAFFSLRRTSGYPRPATTWIVSRPSATGSRPRQDLRNELNRLGRARRSEARARRPASSALPEPGRRPGPLSRSIERCWVGPTPRGRLARRPRGFAAGRGSARRAPRVLAGCPARRAGRTGRAAIVDDVRDPAQRGSIYDRTGTVVLATSSTATGSSAGPKAAHAGAPARGRPGAGRRCWA